MARRPKANGRDVHGVILLDKATGLSSNAALQQVKRLFNANRAGHAGSLDPMATGMLPIFLGEACKLSSYLLSADKTYTASLQLGASTNTEDKDGEITATAAIDGKWQQQLAAALASLHGEIEQIPPMFSAIKIQGQPLYKLARAGKTVKRQARKVTIYNLESSAVGSDSVDFKVHCSKGTYVRTLGVEIAAKLGTLGHLTALRRLQVAHYQAQEMHQFSQLQQIAATGQQQLDKLLLNPQTVVPNWQQLELSAAQAEHILHGRSFNLPLQPPLVAGNCLLLYGGELLALGYLSSTGAVNSKKLLHIVRPRI